ncbi:MAG: hypothetical protein AAFQ58_03835 [Pseudomonadota bacterium]
MLSRKDPFRSIEVRAPDRRNRSFQVNVVNWLRSSVFVTFGGL